MIRTICMLLMVCFGFTAVAAPFRTSFNENWFFQLAASASEVPVEKAWHPVRIPHDWSIEGSFSKNHPATPGGGALPGGTGWYRKHFVLEKEKDAERFFIEFDGVYCNSEVWLNGHFLGKRPNGYISFEYELTPYLYLDGRKNELLVKVDNSQQPNSRWYSGSGIYRNTWLKKTGTLRMAYNGVFATTPVVDNGLAQVKLEVPLLQKTYGPNAGKIRVAISDPAGKLVSSDSVQFRVSGTDTIINFVLNVENPRLWNVENPVLYSVEVLLEEEGKPSDAHRFQTGFRAFAFDPYKGFSLNGKFMKINGVCNHHDLGCLGAAVNKSALRRQLSILKKMGCNGIRMSHNPPAPELLELCDEMGFIVMDEMFDMWEKKKSPFDYHVHWKEWHERDLRDFIRRDRNHPSVFMWSIGNEIPEQWGSGADTSGRKIARELAAIVKELDPTRPVTAANNEVNTHNNIIQSGALDLIGYNYHHQHFAKFHERFPGKNFIATETVSALMTRGHYDHPSDSIRIWPVAWDKPLTTGNPGNTCSSYDNCHAPWGSTHEETWKEVKKHDHISGQFIWTGFDYLGEPTPYGWPSRSSYFGIVDLAGFPKDVYYMYQSEWSQDTVLHVFPHWNWDPGQEVDVWAYYNQADEVELFLNEKSLGIREKKGDDLHVSWKTVFEAGTVRVVSRKNGKKVKEAVLQTAGNPYQLRITPDQKTLRSGNDELAFIAIEVLDNAGNLVPDAENFIRFSVEGDAAITGVDNGNPVSHESFQADFRRAFHGKCLLVVRPGSGAGKIQVKAAADGLLPGTVTLTVE